jgi:4-hydroxythreonine-4-phosphate dehydrogenase
MRRAHVAITIGDPAGAGPQVVAKVLKRMNRIEDAVFFVIGDASVLGHYGFEQRPDIRLIDLKILRRCDWRPGVPNLATARASIAYLKEAVALLKSGACDALVTAPISKESVQKAGFGWPGHTEFLASAFHVTNVEMVFIGDHLKVALATRHVALKKALSLVTIQRIVTCGKTVYELLRRFFVIKNPKIGVCGLNPHAGESGMFGDEEKRVVAPAIRQLNKMLGLHFFGPLAPDTAFHQAAQGAFDFVIALTHDQGLAPFKTVEFNSGMQLTAGLPFIRTSPVHGTAYDIAGTDKVDDRSMGCAISWAARLTKNRYGLR